MTDARSRSRNGLLQRQILPQQVAQCSARAKRSRNSPFSGLRRARSESHVGFGNRRSGGLELPRPVLWRRVLETTAGKQGLEANLGAHCNQARIRPEACRDIVAERRTAHVGNRVCKIV